MRTRLLSTALAVIALGISGGRLHAQGATSVCKDGTTSASSGKGACSGHGGVDAKATAAAKKGAAPATTAAKSTKAPPSTPAATKSAPAAKTNPVPSTPAASKSAAKAAPATKTATADEKDPTDAVAKCKDGTYSHQATHRGACSRHGGVDKFLKP